MMHINRKATMAIDTRLLTHLKGAIFLLHFDPVRIECLSNNNWGNSITTHSQMDSHLDEQVSIIEMVVNIELQAKEVFNFLSKHPTDNYTDFFTPSIGSANAPHLVFNASIAQRNCRNDIESCLCIVLDVSKNPLLKSSSSKLSDNSISLNIFSRREQEVINEMVNGLTSKEIAKKLFITENTVETHRGRIFKKAGVRNVVSLVGRMEIG